jgi:uncharacterized protein (TIGR00297 family)
MYHYDYLIYIFLLVGMVVSVIAGKLTIPGALAGGITGLLVYYGAGLPGLIMLVIFFISGTAATGWRRAKKQRLGAAEENKGRRTAGQVIANGGVAAILGALAWYKPEYAPLLQLMIAGSLASATADTLSSELGTVYGSSFYDVLSFKSTGPGPDGVISLEGTLIGVAGAAVIAAIYSCSFGWNYHFLWVIIAGAVGNFADSLLGATLERRHRIGNNSVNVLNTLVGAITCLVLYSCLHLSFH